MSGHGKIRHSIATLILFRYLPKYLQDEEACNTLEGGEELNEINEKLCQYLGDSWPAIATRHVAKFTVISIPLVSSC